MRRFGTSRQSVEIVITLGGIRPHRTSRLIAALACCVFLASSCSASPDEQADVGPERDGPETTSETTAEAPDEAEEDAPSAGSSSATEGAPAEPSLTDEQLQERLSELGGRLAVGNAAELLVVRPDGASSILLDGSEVVLAAQPTWSRDGERLAWSSVSAERQVIAVQDFGDDGLPAADPQLSLAEGAPVFYLQWSSEDQQLAYIRNSTNRGLVEIGTAEPGAPSIAVGEGAPFFISWSDVGQRIVGHVQQESIDLYKLEDGPVAGFQSVLTVDGGFSAPAWVDDDRVLVVADGALSFLDVSSGMVERVADVPGPVRFVLSPDKSKVAFQTMATGLGPDLVSYRPNSRSRAQSGSRSDAQSHFQSDSQSDSQLIVLDLATGDQVLVTDRLAVAWEWSPDSQKLAWLDAALVGGRARGSWRFWAGEQELGSATTPEFGLSGKYGRNYLPFFAQYTQSVTGWSPDSTAYAFAGTVGRDPGVWIQLVDEAVGAQWVSPGDFVTWGAGAAPLPITAGPSAA